VNQCAKGYPNVAAFLDSDENFTILRRYGWLQWRLLLSKQEELRRLEADLELYEEAMIDQNEDAFKSRDTTGICVEEHAKLLADIETKFQEYASLIDTAQKMMAFGKPSEADRQNVGRYIYNRKPLVQAEEEWFHWRDDLITLKPGREHAWLDGVVESILQMCHCGPIDFLFRSQVRGWT
jgi:hypothetical protein